MSNGSTAGVNGKPAKKSLSDQLDRLGPGIDDLSDGLNEAVIHVVKQAVTAAVQQAVEGVLQALLSNPELLRGLAAGAMPAATAPVAAAEPARRLSALKRFGAWVGSKLRSGWKR